jgi:hypothetical protein
MDVEPEAENAGDRSGEPAGGGIFSWRMLEPPAGEIDAAFQAGLWLNALTFHYMQALFCQPTHRESVASAFQAIQRVSHRLVDADPSGQLVIIMTEETGDAEWRLGNDDMYAEHPPKFWDLEEGQTRAAACSDWVSPALTAADRIRRCLSPGPDRVLGHAMALGELIDQGLRPLDVHKHTDASGDGPGAVRASIVTRHFQPGDLPLREEWFEDVRQICSDLEISFPDRPSDVILRGATGRPLIAYVERIAGDVRSRFPRLEESRRRSLGTPPRLVICRDTRRVWVDGEECIISDPKIFDVFAYLAYQFGKRVLGKKLGSCAENGDSLCFHQDSEKAICHRLDVVRPQEDRYVLSQVVLADSAKETQVVPQTGPDPFQRIVMHLANPVAVIVSCPLVSDVANRRVPEPQLLEVGVGRQLVAVDHRPGAGRIADEGLQGRPIGPLHHPRPKQAGVTAGHTGYRRPIVGEVAMSPPFVGSSPGWVLGIGVKNALLAGILVHLVGLDLRIVGQRRRVGRLHRSALEPMPQPQQVGPMPIQFAGQLGRGGPLGDPPEDQQNLRGATMSLVKLGAGEGIEDPAAGVTAVIDDRGAVTAMDLQAITDPAARANEAARVEDGDKLGIAGVFVHIIHDGKVHGLASS